MRSPGCVLGCVKHCQQHLHNYCCACACVNRTCSADNGPELETRRPGSCRLCVAYLSRLDSAATPSRTADAYFDAASFCGIEGRTGTPSTKVKMAETFSPLSVCKLLTRQTVAGTTCPYTVKSSSVVKRLAAFVCGLSQQLTQADSCVLQTTLHNPDS